MVLRSLIYFIAGISLLSCSSLSKSKSTSTSTSTSQGEGASWQILTQNQETRGGESTGRPVVYDAAPSDFFQKIKTLNSKKEKDRYAILSQIGEYQVHFEFVETLNFSQRKPDLPYYSWATEYIFPLVNEPDRIVLQHILVMESESKEGQPTESHVVKHWRQDWTYEDPVRLDYVGHNRWQKKQMKKDQVRGMWAQAVYQVDDSPRYKSHGQWSHYDQFSRWSGEKIGRPLPRREATVRDDYQLLQGVNKVTVTSSQWVHEQENDKVAVNPKTFRTSSILGREIGLNRYLRIKDFDFSPGKNYWEETKDYWALVRAEWDRVISGRKTFALKNKVNDSKLYQTHFSFADKVFKGEVKNQEQMQEQARSAISDFLIQ